MQQIPLMSERETLVNQAILCKSPEAPTPNVFKQQERSIVSTLTRDFDNSIFEKQPKTTNIFSSLAPKEKVNSRASQLYQVEKLRQLYPRRQTQETHRHPNPNYLVERYK